jgi:hypothetical protein
MGMVWVGDTYVGGGSHLVVMVRFVTVEMLCAVELDKEMEME